ncbi:MAG TPA: hypothetical protein DEH78_09370, partial [Solibacterales bacterium]|nr:hypothetical protein [Bryobacterales bacterium]
MEDSRSELLLQVRELRRDLERFQRRLGEIEAAATRDDGDEGGYEPEVVAAPGGGSAALAPQTAALAPLFGWAFLGLSGAYLLRAATEAGTVPMLAGVAAGVIYSGWWLLLAARVAASKPVATTVYAVTGVLVLAPLLWEATIRFQVFSATAASVVLVAFAAFGLAVGWRHNLTGIACVATLTGLFTPMALFRETHDGAAWAMSVLAIAAAVEFSACRDHWLGLRWIAAGVADVTVLLLTVLVTLRADQTYAAPPFVLGAQIALLLIYLASTVDRTVIRKLPITWFEVVQAGAAFLVGVGGALRLADTTVIGWMPVGIFCLAAAAACYAISFALLERPSLPSRNFYAYSTYALLLTMAGCRVLAAGERVALAWALLALCLMTVALMTGRRTLKLHASAMLALAAGAAGVAQTAWGGVLGTPGATPGLSYFAVLGSALTVYAAILFFGRRGDSAAT